MQPIAVFQYTLHVVRRDFAILLISSILLISFLTQIAPVKGQSVEEGKELFTASCSACHGPDALGVPNLGKDLVNSEFMKSLPDEELLTFVKTGRPIWDPENTTGIDMPAKGGNPALTDGDILSIIVYLRSLSTNDIVATEPGTEESTPTPVPTALPAGDPAIGKNMFTGAIRFENDGPPCMGCHSIAGLGALGGGVLGPDLTQTSITYGDAFGSYIDGILSNPLATMNPIFGEDERPLTPQEKADVRAFLLQATITGRSATALGQLTLLAVVGAGILLALAHYIWRDRLGGVRQPLIERSKLVS